VPEIYHEFLPREWRFITTKTEPRAATSSKITKTLASYDDDARAALTFLKSHPNCTGKLGVAGFCIGGHLAFRAAMNPEVRATACWYPTDIHEGSLGQGKHEIRWRGVGDIAGEMVMIFGRQDPHIPQEGRQLI